MAFPATLAWPDNQAPWDDLVAKALEEPLAPLAGLSQYPALKAPTDLPDHLENKVQRVSPAPTDRASLVPLANRESLANPARKVVRAHPEVRVPPATRDKKEDATIVQSPAHHQAIKRNTPTLPTERSGFRQLGNGTLSITLLFCFLFTTGRKSRKIFFDSMPLF
jgi:hypothetical protein